MRQLARKIQPGMPNPPAASSTRSRGRRTSRAGQTAGAIYSVRSPVIAALMTYDQRRWNARWLPLGTIDSAGEELVVTVRNAGTGALVADALRIIALQPSAMAAPRSSSRARSTER
jgi:hypothetical protein